MSLAVGLCSFNLSLVFMLCTEVLNVKVSKLDERNLIEESMYWEVSVNISSKNMVGVNP